MSEDFGKKKFIVIALKTMARMTYVPYHTANNGCQKFKRGPIMSINLKLCCRLVGYFEGKKM